MEREAWDQLPDEGAKPFKAFSIYADLPPDKRSLLEVSRRFYNKPEAKRPAGRITKWSSEFKWTERATMRDAWKQDLRREAEARLESEQAELWAKRRMEAREEGYSLGMALAERALEILALPITKKTETTVELSEDGETIVKNITIEPLAVRARDAATIGRIALELVRVSSGLQKSGGVNDIDLSKLSEDELRKLASGRAFPSS